MPTKIDSAAPFDEARELSFAEIDEVSGAFIGGLIDNINRTVNKITIAVELTIGLLVSPKCN